MSENIIEISGKNVFYRVERKFTAVDNGPPNKWNYNFRDGWGKYFQVGGDKLEGGYLLWLTSNNHDPVNPIENWAVANSLEDADRKNYQKAKELADKMLQRFPEGRIVDITKK
jgi:hypothetical protein